MEDPPTNPSHPSSRLKYHHPYLTSQEIEFLSEKQRGKSSVTQEEKYRQSACAYLEALGAKVGFPRRTIATAQNLHHRFYLFLPRKEYPNYFEVALASLFVSTKMHDTLKKPRELQAASYAVRFPELVAKSKNPVGDIDLDTLDPQMVDHDRQRILSLERLILETICFNFTSRMPFSYVVKVGKVLKASKKLSKLAWRLAVDCHRTLVPIEYPPHTVALACLYVASLLSSFEQPSVTEPEGTRTPIEVASLLGQKGDWEKTFHTQVEDLEVIAHTIIDLLAQGASAIGSTHTSPRTPSSPSPNPLSRNQYPPLSVLSNNPYTMDQLIRLKIAMRETDHEPRPIRILTDDDDIVKNEDTNMLGRNEGTVRFLFRPPNF